MSSRPTGGGWSATPVRLLANLVEAAGLTGTFTSVLPGPAAARLRDSRTPKGQGVPVPEIAGKLTIKARKDAGTSPSVASL